MPTPISPTEARLRRIQTALGVDVDGVLGPETLTALETRLEIVAKPGTTRLECSASSLDEIVKFEVSSKAFYDKKLKSPVWPGGHSGVTIGIGYDIGVTSRAEITADWSGEIPDADLTALLVAQGTTGDAAKVLAGRLKAISIPFEVASQVFYKSTLPRYAQSTRATYPGVEKLPADAQGMLLSLVYNRGAKLTGPARAEMAAIKPLVAGGVKNLDAIADQFESMVRLWPDLPGLQKRRQREAELIRESDRTYEPDELIRI
jgi:GH24 family phage-related lysozyme (muramidase)